MMEKGWEVIDDSKDEPIELEENQTKVTDDGSVLKTLIREGTSDEELTTGCKVQVLYTGWSEDGEVFGSCLDPNEPFEYEVNKAAVVKGFDICVASMKIGEKASFVVRPKQTGGSCKNPPNIPPEEIVQFEIELLGWHSENLSPQADGGIIRHIITKSDSKIRPNNGAFVKTHVTGSYEGRVFDDRDLMFYVGEIQNDELCPGVQIGLMRFRLGEKSKLIIKPDYGFLEKDLELYNIPLDATIEYEVTLKECERAGEAHEQDTKQNLAQAKATKDRATIYYIQNKYELAARVFDKANTFLQNCTIAKPTNLDLIDEPHRLKTTIFLNVAQCFLKLELYYEARKACDTALEIDRRNVKGYFRRGTAFLKSGDAAAALEDFLQAQKYDPENKAVMNQITICKQEIKRQDVKDRELYKSMLKFARENKAKREQAKLKADGGKNTDDAGEDDDESDSDDEDTTEN